MASFGKPLCYGLIVDLSQFVTAPPLKLSLTIKVIKRDTEKIILRLLQRSKSLIHSVFLQHAYAFSTRYRLGIQITERQNEKIIIKLN